MRKAEAARMVAGSVVVYVIVAACSGGGNTLSPMGSSGTMGGAGTVATGSGAVAGTGAHSGSVASSGTLDGSSGSHTGNAIADATADHTGTGASGRSLMDVLTDPVAQAKADNNTSGTRLKVKRIMGADGSSVVQTMHDSQLNVDCYYETAADGTLRCLPSWPASAGIVGSFFSDSKCSQPLAYTYAGCAMPPYVYQDDPNSCAGQPTVHIFSVAASFTGTPYSGTPASCSSAASYATTYQFLTPGAEVPATSFVQGTVQVDP